jgi:hypothetical protein
MAITVRVDSIVGGVKKNDVAWVSAMDGEALICRIAIPYSEDNETFKAKIVERMRPFVMKHVSKADIKASAQAVANSINIEMEVKK